MPSSISPLHSNQINLSALVIMNRTNRLHLKITRRHTSIWIYHSPIIDCQTYWVILFYFRAFGGLYYHISHATSSKNPVRWHAHRVSKPTRWWLRHDDNRFRAVTTVEYIKIFINSLLEGSASQMMMGLSDPLPMGPIGICRNQTS